MFGCPLGEWILSRNSYRIRQIEYWRIYRIWFIFFFGKRNRWSLSLAYFPNNRDVGCNEAFFMDRFTASPASFAHVTGNSFSLTGHRTRSDERDQANAYEQFHFSDRLSELGFEGLRRSIRDNSFGPFTELHPGPLQPVKLPPDASSAFSALNPGKLNSKFKVSLTMDLVHFLKFEKLSSPLKRLLSTVLV